MKHAKVLTTWEARNQLGDTVDLTNGPLGSGRTPSVTAPPL
jgi:hypothetical protein